MCADFHYADGSITPARRVKLIGYPMDDWHNEARRQYVIVLSGQMEVTVGDGTARVLNAGDVMLAEDLTGQGHKICSLGRGPYLQVAIPAE